MGKFWDKNGKMTILGIKGVIKLSRKIFFTRFQFTCEHWMHQTKNSIKKFEFLGKRDFYASLKICRFWKLTPDLENHHKHHFKMTAVAWKVKAYTATSFKTDLGRFSKQKSYPSYVLLFFVHTFKISIKWFLTGEYHWSLCQNMKTPKHEEINR